jgi:hypothetical protein
MISVPDLGLGAGAGCIVGIALGADLKGLFEKVGEIDAISSRIEQVAARAYREAFEGEAGKRLASHQDIENVLSEVRKVTTETESIKAQISGDVWLRQAVWLQKREAYAALLKSLNEVERSFKELSLSLAAMESRTAGPESEDNDVQLAEANKKREAAYDSLSETIFLFDVAALFDPRISEQRKQLAEGYGFDAAMKASATFEETKEFVIGLMRFRRDRLSHMRRELGVSASAAAAVAFKPSPSSPITSEGVKHSGA